MSHKLDQASMKIHTDLILESVPHVFRRSPHVAAIPFTTTGQVALGGKPHYYPGIWRLIGGGVDPNEQPVSAAAREFIEETGHQTSADQLLPIAQLTFLIHPKSPSQWSPITFVEYLFGLPLPDKTVLKPQSDLTEIKWLNPTEQLTLLARYKSLDNSPLPRSDNGTWADYAAVFGPIHQLAFEWVAANSKSAA